MRFYKLDSPEIISKIIAEKISEKLISGQKVFWIVTGGSAIRVALGVSKLLANQNLENLTVTLTDERFGTVGHRDSNWQQLIQAGFSLPSAKLLPVLQGQDRRKSTDYFSKSLAKNFDSCDYSLGIFGIGPDGHVAGILPGSPNIDSGEMAIGYSDDQVRIASPDGVKRGGDRITMSAAAIARLDEVIVCAFGEAKHQWLDKLEKDLPIEQNPAQSLKQVKNLLIYNDYKGGEI